MSVKCPCLDSKLSSTNRLPTRWQRCFCTGIFRMKRRNFLTALAGILTVSIRPFTLNAADIAPLVDQLKAGLKARKPSEHLFIEQVGKLVEKRVLPVSMVLGIFSYARKKHSRYPFPYFQQALRIRAEKEFGVKL